MFYERDPDNFKVAINYYATKQTYDARMWQTIEYKAAASGNPLILLQVQLASDLRKLEALYSQHQRAQHRLRDRLKWLDSAPDRLAGAEADHAANLRLRDNNTHRFTEKGKERIRLEISIKGQIRYEKDNEYIKKAIIDGVKAVTREPRKSSLLGTYRGFEVYVQRTALTPSGDGFRFALKGAGEQEVQPNNLIYEFDEKISLSGFFQRTDNFLEKGLDEAFQNLRDSLKREIAEIGTAIPHK